MLNPSIRPLVSLYYFSYLKLSDLDCVPNEVIVQPSDLSEENKKKINNLLISRRGKGGDPSRGYLPSLLRFS